MRPSSKRIFSRRAILLLILPATLAIPARPQAVDTSQEQQLKQLSLEQLGNLEVTTVSKAPEQVWQAAAAIYVITQEDIERSGATSIPEALRLAPGVEVARIDGSKWSIGIRGFGSRLSRSVLVLIDGRSVYSTLLAGTYWEVQDTVMEDIDRIEVIRGPGGTVWGPNAVDGVINIITKNTKETQGALVTAVGGNEEEGSASIRYGGNNGKGLSYRVYGKGFNRSAEIHSDGNNFDRWGAVQSGFRVDLAKNTRDAFTLQGDMYDEHAGESVQAVSYTPPYSQVINGNAYLSGGNLLGRWTRTFSEGNDIQLQAYYDRTNRHEPNFGDLRDTVDVDFLERFHIRSRNHISWGLGARESRGNELEVVSGLQFIPSKRTDQLYTAFVQDDITLVQNRLTLEVGTKLLRTNYTGVEPEPSARLLWTPSETQTVWLAATRAVRTPSDAEEDFFLSGFVGLTNIVTQVVTPTGPVNVTTTVPEFARFNGNPNFKPEILDGYELGYRRLVRKNVYVDVASFFNQYDNLFSEDITGPAFIETDPAPIHTLIPAEFGNGLLGSTAGVEVAPEWRPTSFWRLRGSYSLLHMSIWRAPGSLDVGTAAGIVGSSPQHQVAVQSSFDLPKHFSLDIDYWFISALAAAGAPAYSTANARLAWTFRRQWELSAVGENLFQPYHVEFSGEPGPAVAIKRSGYAKLVWRSKGY